MSFTNNSSVLQANNDYSKDLSQGNNELFLSCTRNKEILMYKNKGRPIENFNREKKLQHKTNNIPGPNRYDVQKEVYEKKQKISFRKCLSLYW